MGNGLFLLLGIIGFIVFFILFIIYSLCSILKSRLLSAPQPAPR